MKPRPARSSSSSSRPSSSSSPRVNFPLLVLCYFEIVLWSACLLSSGASAAGLSDAGQTYLQRETGNLKAFTRQELRPVFDELALAVSELHHHLEHLSLRQLFAAWTEAGASLLQQPQSLSLRALTAVQGLPAPFTGVQAID